MFERQPLTLGSLVYAQIITFYFEGDTGAASYFARAEEVHAISDRFPVIQGPDKANGVRPAGDLSQAVSDAKRYPGLNLAMIPCLWVEAADRHVVVPLPDDEAGVARTVRRLCDVLHQAKSFADVETVYGKSSPITGRPGLDGEDLKLARLTLQRAFNVRGLERLVTPVYRNLADDVNWANDLAQVAFEVVERAQNHGVLDRVIAAAVAERPFVPELRATALHLGERLGWTSALKAHGMDIKAGLEQLTGEGNPFMDTTLLARWLIGAERRVCRVRCGADLGTGFLIGPDLVLTCYHVVRGHISTTVPASDVAVLFDYRRDAAGADPTEDPQRWIGIDPAWEIPHSSFSPWDVSLTGVEPTPDELDYAILKLKKSPGSEQPPNESDPRGWEDVSTDRVLPPKGNPILIVQHPGVPGSNPPAQQPLQITFATPGFESAVARGRRVRYKPSTLPGSSGSPVYDRAFKVVALHHNRGQIAAEAPFFENNQGIPLALIREHLGAKHKQVLAALTPCP